MSLASKRKITGHGLDCELKFSQPDVLLEFAVAVAEAHAPRTARELSNTMFESVQCLVALSNLGSTERETQKLQLFARNHAAFVIIDAQFETFFEEPRDVGFHALRPHYQR